MRIARRRVLGGVVGAGALCGCSGHSHGSAGPGMTTSASSVVAPASATAGGSTAGSAAAASGSVSTAAQPLSDDDAVLEVVFLHEIEVARPRADEPLCLRVRTGKGALGDASAALVAAIRRHHPLAVPASACDGGGPAAPVRLVDGAKPAMMFDIGPVEWPSSGEARVVGGGGSRGASSAIREVEYLLERNGAVFELRTEQLLRQN